MVRDTSQVFVAGPPVVARAGEHVTHAVGNGRRHAYLFVTQGEVIVNGRELSAGDQARIADEVTLDLAATTDAELILLDLP